MPITNQIPQPVPHPLKAEKKRSGLTLWHLSQFASGKIGKRIDEAELSKMLGGKRPMPDAVEMAIREAIEIARGEAG